MKRILVIFAVCRICLACTVLNGEGNERNRDNMSIVSNQLFSLVSSDVVLIDYCLLIDDYLNADDEGRKSEKYSGIGYYSKDNRFVIDDFGEITTDGKSIFDPAMKWTAKLSVSEYTTRKITYSGNKIWEVKPGSEAEQSTFDVKDRVRHTGLDEEKRNVWECESSGEYKESTDYKVAFCSEGPITFIKNGQTSLLFTTGQFRVDFYRNGLPVDWYKTYYNKGDITEEESSLD